MPLALGLHLGPFDALGLGEYAQRFRFGEVVPGHDAAVAGVRVAPEVEGVHAGTVAGRWLMAQATGTLNGG